MSVPDLITESGEFVRMLSMHVLAQFGQSSTKRQEIFKKRFKNVSNPQNVKTFKKRLKTAR